jgi:dolichol-phosphate mannosyltransferase
MSPTKDGSGVSIVIPAYREDVHIVPVLDRIRRGVESPCEVLVVVDFPEDPTVAAVEDFARSHPCVRAVVSNYGRGPAQAIRYGVDQARHPVVVVTMADGSDDPRQIDTLVRLVERGVVIAAASRYAAGGQQVGGPALKAAMSRAAGLSLSMLGRVGTHDATNSFKAYSTEFVREVGIDSRSGFEIGLELVAKARRLRLPVAEVSTIWLERTIGKSNFRLREWVPKYFRWYRFAFGPSLSLEEVRMQAALIAQRNGFVEGVQQA